jgi:hypothetical protein
MWSFILLAALAGPVTAPQQGDVGHTDWAKLPPLQAVDRSLPTVQMVDKVETMLASGNCKLRGQSPQRFDITIPYAALVKPDGGVEHVIVSETGCAELETFVGEIVLQLAREGDFHPTAQSQARWYGSKLNFNLQ